MLSYDKLGLLQGLPTEACTPLLTADIPNAQSGGGGGENVTRRHIRYTSAALPTGIVPAETLR